MKPIARLMITLVVLFSLFSVASATYTPSDLYDTYTSEPSSSDADGSNNPTAPQLKVSDQLEMGGTACIDSEVTYFVFDASNIGTATSASLVLTHGATLNGLASNPVLSLYGVADFNKDTLNGLNNPHPGLADLIQNMPIPSTTAAYSTIIFGGADSALAEYIQEQVDAKDYTITLALSFSANCATVTQVNFFSLDYTTDQSRRPQLTIEGTTPTAVNMTTTSAERTSLPLYAGLGAVALIVVAGLAISRRRTA